MKPKILFAAFEAAPFLKTGGLGDVAGSLPAALRREGFDVRVVLPLLHQIPAEYRDAMKPLAVGSVPLSWRNQYCGVKTLTFGGVPFYFLDNEYYFARDLVYGCYDDGERIAFFSKAILEMLPRLGWFPDILHCNDWHTALTPVFLREQYGALPAYQKLRTVFTIHNIKFQGVYGGAVLGDVLGLNGCKNAADQLLRPNGDVNYMQGALYYSDAITTVSPTYAEELCTPAFGEGLDGIFRQRRDRLTGILNGIDTALYAPKNAGAPFSAKDPAGKTACKTALQRELGLPVRPAVPLMAFVSRLTEQKGLELLAGCLPELLQTDVQLAVLGVGEGRYEQMLRDLGASAPDKAAIRLCFDEPLSRRIYAGADLLLMPSVFEPCGLSQMIAMENGTVPIVRETGGLRDTVTAYNEFTGEGTGFSFFQCDSRTLLDTIRRALALYHDHPDEWNRMRVRDMEQDFGWASSAKQYAALYRSLL